MGILSVMILRNHVVAYSGRLKLLEIKEKPIDLNIIQVYFPTSDCPNKEIEGIYYQIERYNNRT